MLSRINKLFTTPYSQLKPKIPFQACARPGSKIEWTCSDYRGS